MRTIRRVVLAAVAALALASLFAGPASAGWMW